MSNETVGYDGEFVVEEAVKLRIDDGQVQYYLKWEGYSSDENTWEPMANLNFSEFIEAYEARIKNESEEQNAKKTTVFNASTTTAAPQVPFSARMVTKPARTTIASILTAMITANGPPAPTHSRSILTFFFFLCVFLFIYFFPEYDN